VIPYAKVMQKLGLSKEQVLEEASRLGLEIDEEHFEMPSESKKGRPKAEKPVSEEENKADKKKGRPKKSKKVLEIETNDIFAELVAATSSSESEDETVKYSEKTDKEAENESEKETEKQKKEAEKAAKEAEKQKKEAEKAAKEAEKKKKEAEKAAKEADKKKKEAEKAAKEAEKKQKVTEKPSKVAEKKPAKEDEPIKLFLVKAWEKDLALDGDDWRVDTLEVEETILDFCQSHRNVKEIVCDPFRWQRSMQVLDDAGLPIVEFPQSPSRMIKACSTFFDAVMEERIEHDGNPTLARHLDNAVVKMTPAGPHIKKDGRASPRKIDAAVASVMAVDRASAGRIEQVVPQFFF
jgi:chemotaxis protein histidine kinase CheA